MLSVTSNVNLSIVHRNGSERNQIGRGPDGYRLQRSTGGRRSPGDPEVRNKCKKRIRK